MALLSRKSRKAAEPAKGSAEKATPAPESGKPADQVEPEPAPQETAQRRIPPHVDDEW